MWLKTPTVLGQNPDFAGSKLHLWWLKTPTVLAPFRTVIVRPTMSNNTRIGHNRLVFVYYNHAKTSEKSGVEAPWSRQERYVVF